MDLILFVMRYLSFVNNQDEGTWIYGDVPGVDSGRIFARVPRKTFTPLDASGGWQAWQDKKWTKQPDITLTCTDEIQTLSLGSVDRVVDGDRIESYTIIAGDKNLVNLLKNSI